MYILASKAILSHPRVFAMQDLEMLKSEFLELHVASPVITCIHKGSHTACTFVYTKELKCDQLKCVTTHSGFTDSRQNFAKHCEAT